MSKLGARSMSPSRHGQRRRRERERVVEPDKGIAEALEASSTHCRLNALTLGCARVGGVDPRRRYRPVVANLDLYHRDPGATARTAPRREADAPERFDDLKTRQPLRQRRRLIALVRGSRYDGLRSKVITASPQSDSFAAVSLTTNALLKLSRRQAAQRWFRDWHRGVSWQWRLVHGRGVGHRRARRGGRCRLRMRQGDGVSGCECVGSGGVHRVRAAGTHRNQHKLRGDARRRLWHAASAFHTLLN